MAVNFHNPWIFETDSKNSTEITISGVFPFTMKEHRAGKLLQRSLHRLLTSRALLWNVPDADLKCKSLSGLVDEQGSPSAEHR